MSIEEKLFFSAAAIAVVLVMIILYRRFPKRLKPDRFGAKWKQLQDCLKDKKLWADALIKADSLLDEALKKRKFKGGSMGERMVSAQRYFTNNDDLWFAHNLCKKLKANQEIKLSEDDVKDALIGFRQGLRDLGALKSDKPSDS